MLGLFAEAYRLEALAFIEKTLDSVADMPPETQWTNVEVVAMVEDIRSLILTGTLVPGGFTREPTQAHGSTERES